MSVFDSTVYKMEMISGGKRLLVVALGTPSLCSHYHWPAWALNCPRRWWGGSAWNFLLFNIFWECWAFVLPLNVTSVQDVAKGLVQLGFSLMCHLSLWFCGWWWELYACCPFESHNGFQHVLPPAVNLETMCADDLLSVLLYLLVKTEIPNW